MNGCLDLAHDPWRVCVCSVHSSVGVWGGEGPGRLVDRERIFSLHIPLYLVAILLAKNKSSPYV